MTLTLLGKRRDKWLLKLMPLFLIFFLLYTYLMMADEEDAHRKASVVTQRKIVRPAAGNPGNCSSWFEEKFEENLRVIENYPKGDADKYLPLIGGDLQQPIQMSSLPVVVTAANDAHYGVIEALFKSVHEILMPTYKGLRIVFYDLGLRTEQRNKLIQYCSCDVRYFPFDEFPSHVSTLKTYAWKPLIIHKTLMEFGAIWWLDSSVRFTTDDLNRPMEYARENGILFFTYGPSLSVTQHTDSQTFRYLKEDPCKFRQFGENEAGFGLYYWHNVSRVVVRSWAACALNKDCISPPGTENKLRCVPTETRDGHCHRFDQSIHSIMTRRLYHAKNDYPDVKEPFHIHVVRRGEKIKYFPD